MDKQKTKEIIFRANMIMIKMMYQNILQIVPRKYPSYARIGKERMNTLYEILGTNRPYFSNMCNGHQKAATKTMIKKVEDSESMLAIISGEQLINIGKYDTPEKWEKVFEDKSKEKEVEISVHTWMKNLALNAGSVGAGLEKDCVIWLMSRIKEYVDKKDTTIDGIVYEKAAGFMELTFEQLDNCHPETISRMYNDIKNSYTNFLAVYQYKCADHSGKKRKKSTNGK